MDKIKIKTYIIIAIYFVLIGILMMLTFDLTNTYEKEEAKMITNIESLIDNAVTNNSDERMKEILINSRDEYTYDIVITRGEDVLLSTFPYQLGDSLNFRANDKIISKINSYDVYKTEGSTDIWYAIYRLSDRVYIQSYLESIILIVSILTLIVTLTIILISERLFNPLRNIKKSIEQASNYDFGSINSGEDKINVKFKTFVSRLEHDISAVTRQHTELEKEIQANRKHLNNTVAVSRSMIHDIKTPVHRNILENERFEEQMPDHQGIAELTQLNELLNHQIMLDINSILKMLKVDYEKLDAQEKRVNITEIINHSLSIFKHEADTKGIILKFNAEDYDLDIVESRFILMINTLLLTMLTYANKDSILETQLKCEDNKLILTMENEANKDNRQRFLLTESLFNTVDNDEDDSGLYLVKELVIMLNGKYKAYEKLGGVKIEVILDHEKNNQ